MSLNLFLRRLRIFYVVMYESIVTANFAFILRSAPGATLRCGKNAICLEDVSIDRRCVHQMLTLLWQVALLGPDRRRWQLQDVQMEEVTNKIRVIYGRK